MGEIERPNDSVLPFYLDKGKVKGKLVRLGKQVQTLLDHHTYPDIVNKYLIELIALGAALSADMKESGTLTLQITGGKVIRLLVVDVNHMGHVRACAKWDTDLLSQCLEEHHGHLSIPQAFENGYMVITADFSHQDEKSQAIVELSGKTLADCIHHYFRQSDQVQSALVLYSHTDISKAYLGGIVLLQKLASPSHLSMQELEDEDNNWLTNLSLLGTLGSKELLDQNIDHATLLYRLFHEQGVHAFDTKPIIFQCSCSQQRIEGMLNTFSPDEQAHMAQEGIITITCEFCNQTYTVCNSKKL
jgi:molecular chaperone Hsp33